MWLQKKQRFEEHFRPMFRIRCFITQDLRRIEEIWISWCAVGLELAPASGADIMARLFSLASVNIRWKHEDITKEIGNKLSDVWCGEERGKRVSRQVNLCIHATACEHSQCVKMLWRMSYWALQSNQDWTEKKKFSTKLFGGLFTTCHIALTSSPKRFRWPSWSVLALPLGAKSPFFCVSLPVSVTVGSSQASFICEVSKISRFADSTVN